MNPIPINYFKSIEQEMVAELSELVKIESPSTDKAALDQMGEALAAYIQPLAPEIEIDIQPDAGNNVIARWDGTNSADSGGFLFLCHFDTVHPIGMLAENPVRVEGGELYGPGVYDMKGSIVQVVTALRALQEQEKWPSVPVTALFTSDEEVGSRGARPLIQRLAAQAQVSLCMEPALPGGAVKTGRKGVGNFKVSVRGKAVHAGADHSSGVNAIEEMANQIMALQALTDYKRGTTVNVGVVQGGTRNNVVPDECEIDVDLRVVSQEEGERMEQAIHGLQPILEGAQLSVKGSVYRPPMERSSIIATTYEQVRGIAASLEIDLGEGSTGGASDANFVAALRLPVLDGLGPIGSGAHTRTESLTISSLAPRTALIAAILSEWSTS